MQECASCYNDMEEDDDVVLLESGDVICTACAAIVGEEFPLEIAKRLKLNEVHSDWRVS